MANTLTSNSFFNVFQFIAIVSVKFFYELLNSSGIYDNMLSKGFVRLLDLRLSYMYRYTDTSGTFETSCSKH